MSLHRAILATPSDDVFDALQNIALQNGFDVDRTRDAMLGNAPLGLVSIAVSGVRTQIDFDATTPAELQLLKDIYAQRFSKLGLGSDIEWSAPASTVPLNQVMCEVHACEQISPNFCRMRLTGDFSSFARPDTGLHFRFLFGPADAPPPYLDENGLTQWPGGLERWHRPVYTVRRQSAEADWIDVDIVLHAGGRVTDWCSHVTIGDRIAINGPTASKRPTASRLVLLGDETAMPVILRILEGVPENSEARAVIALRDVDDAQSIKSSENVDLRWIDMAKPQGLLDCIPPLQPVADQFIFFAAERAQAASARALLKASDLPASAYKAAAYWTREE